MKVVYFDFDEALEVLKEGRAVARETWLSKGMWLKMIEGKGWGLNPFPYIENDTPGELLSFIGIRTSDNKFVPWLASHTDMLGDDWYEIEPRPEEKEGFYDRSDRPNSFGTAIKTLKRGGVVARRCWDSSSRFLTLVQGYPVNKHLQAAHPNAMVSGSTCMNSGQMRSHILMCIDGASKYWGEGYSDYIPWSMSQEDLLVEDWYEVDLVVNKVIQATEECNESVVLKAVKNYPMSAAPERTDIVMDECSATSDARADEAVMEDLKSIVSEWLYRRIEAFMETDLVAYKYSIHENDPEGELGATGHIGGTAEHVIFWVKQGAGHSRGDHQVTYNILIQEKPVKKYFRFHF